MKDFVDQMMDDAIEYNIPTIEKIMDEVTRNVTKDFAHEAYRLLDNYYDDYTPFRYVRLYAPKRKLRTKRGWTTRKPKSGGISLWNAVTKQEGDMPAIGAFGGSFDKGYVAGIEFNDRYFARYNMKHIDKGKGFKETNIVENFLFAGQGGYGDIRGVNEEYTAPPADDMLELFMSGYDARFDQHYQNAYKKYR